MHFPYILAWRIPYLILLDVIILIRYDEEQKLSSSSWCCCIYSPFTPTSFLFPNIFLFSISGSLQCKSVTKVSIHAMNVTQVADIIINLGFRWRLVGNLTLRPLSLWEKDSSTQWTDNQYDNKWVLNMMLDSHPVSNCWSKWLPILNFTVIEFFILRRKKCIFLSTAHVFTLLCFF